MNGFMIKSDRYWFPSAESKYRDSLTELREYYHKLERGEAQFYTRTDNLIPLFVALPLAVALLIQLVARKRPVLSGGLTSLALLALFLMSCLAAGHQGDRKEPEEDPASVLKA